MGCACVSIAPPSPKLPRKKTLRLPNSPASRPVCGPRGEPVVHFRCRSRDEVRDVGRSREAAPAENVLRQGEPAVDDVGSGGDVDLFARDERVHFLGRRPEPEADLPPRARGERDPGRFQEPLRVDDDVGLEGAKGREKGSKLSARSRGEGALPPGPGRRDEDLVHVRRPRDELGERSLHRPGEAVPLSAQRLRQREGEDDVAEGGESNEENLHRRFAILSSTWCSTRRSWC